MRRPAFYYNNNGFLKSLERSLFIHMSLLNKAQDTTLTNQTADIQHDHRDVKPS